MLAVIALTLAGLVLGVLVNVLADCLPEGVRLRAPHCATCGHRHRPAWWSALASLAVRRGRCEHCGAPRGWRHALVELASVGAVWLAWSRHQDLLQIVQAILVVETFLLVTVIDIEHRLILNEIMLPAAVLMVAVGALSPRHTLGEVLLGGVAGYVIFLLFYLVGVGFSRIVARRRGTAVDEPALGGGDVNLAGVIGLLVGWQGLIVALAVGMGAAAAVAAAYLVYKLLRRRYAPLMDFIPYGPFLVLGALAVYLFPDEIIAWWAGL